MKKMSQFFNYVASNYINHEKKPAQANIFFYQANLIYSTGYKKEYMNT